MPWMTKLSTQTVYFVSFASWGEFNFPICQYYIYTLEANTSMTQITVSAINFIVFNKSNNRLVQPCNIFYFVYYYTRLFILIFINLYRTPFNHCYLY